MPTIIDLSKPIQYNANDTLDPNNIAEISILKGLKATTLYGEGVSSQYITHCQNRII